MISGWYNEAVPASLSVSPSSALRWCGCGFCKEVAASDISSELIVRQRAWADAAASSFSPLSQCFSPGKFTQDKLFLCFDLNVHFSTPKTDDLHPEMFKIWPMCWCSAAIPWFSSAACKPGWRKSDRRFDQGKASLWCGLPCGGSDLILTLCPTSGFRGLCLYEREESVCVSFVLLLDLHWVNHCSRFKLWRQRFLPMRHHSSRACVVWADQAIYVLPQQKTVPLASYSFHIVPSLSSANVDHIFVFVYKSYS